MLALTSADALACGTGPSLPGRCYSPSGAPPRDAAATAHSITQRRCTAPVRSGVAAAESFGCSCAVASVTATSSSSSCGSSSGSDAGGWGPRTELGCGGRPSSTARRSSMSLSASGAADAPLPQSSGGRRHRQLEAAAEAEAVVGCGCGQWTTLQARQRCCGGREGPHRGERQPQRRHPHRRERWRGKEEPLARPEGSGLAGVMPVRRQEEVATSFGYRRATVGVTPSGAAAPAPATRHGPTVLRRQLGGAPSDAHGCGGGVSGCDGMLLRQRRRQGAGGPQSLRPPQLLVSLLLAAALPSLLVSGPCTAAAEWSWVLARSRAASGAVSSSPAVAAQAGPGGWSFSGMLPYGWRTHVVSSDGSSGHSSSSSSHSGSSNSRSSSSSSKKSKGTGKASAAGVTFSAGVVPVTVNPGGNVTELLEYDPYSPPPPTPPPPAPPGSKKPRVVKHRRGDDSGPRLLSDAQLALRELLTATRSQQPPYDIMKPYKLPAASYRTSDFVFATGSFPARYILAQATRGWRRGIRAFIAVNNTEDVPLLNERNRIHNEHYDYFPDDGTGDLGPLYHGYMAGDTRAAMAPFLAHEHFGETYKWMLYGDDDTVFYMPSVKRLLAHLDPELPFAISDNLWFRARHPNLFAPRCLPCHLGVDADPPPPPPADDGAAGATAAAAKPVRIPNITTVMDGYQRFLLGVRSASDLESARVQKLLSKNTFGDFNKSLAAIAHLPPDASVPGVRYVPRPACPFCTAAAACNPTPPTNHNVSGAGCFSSGGHGGAGMIFSVGLLRRLSSQRMKACYMKIIKAPGGDGMLSSCLWEAGYAFTDPGASTLARYDGNYLMFSSEAAKWALHDPLAVLLKGKCDARCKWLLRNAASHHGRGRHFQNFEQSAAYVYGNMASYTATHKWLAFMAGRDADLDELEKLAAAAGGSAEEEDDSGGEGGK